MEQAKSGVTIQSLQIGLRIVDLIAKQQKPIKFADICEMTQITKSNLYKYLNTLTGAGILYRDKESGMFSLGSKLIEYGMAAINQENMVERISPYLQEINRHCGNTALFSVWTHSGPMVVRICNNSRAGLNIGAQMGTVLPVLSASGKLFAAFMDEGVIGSWKNSGIARLDSESAAEFERELNRVREQGISFASEPLVPSVSSMSIPVLNYKRELVGTVTLVGFSNQIPQQIEHEISEYMLKASAELSGLFGYPSA
ncbi:IclR family transcriptional regulator [Brevibacillus centrosporus]|uniref:IclR family transcriptional regulator n=1 Tax=Brevibacillus centrosporus TaxID=54910 RepID=UPI002E1B086D|nr:IclR family transcriptional regulator [Brevibacillus centrosporus]